MHTLIAAVGSNDIKQYNAEKFPDGDPFRDPLDAKYEGPPRSRLIGKDLLTRGVATNEYVIPIVYPVLQAMVARKFPPGQIILIASNQEPEHPTDTLHYATLIERWLKEDPRSPCPHATITIIEYPQNPSDYDYAFNRLREIYRKMPKGEGESCHISVTAATGALTAALLTEGIAAFDRRAHAWYAPRPEPSSPSAPRAHDKVRELNVANNLRSQTLRRALQTNIDAYAYDAAHRLCAENKDLLATLFGDSPDGVRRLALFQMLIVQGRERLNGNWRDAKQSLAEGDAPDALTALSSTERSLLDLTLPADAAYLVLDAGEREELRESALTICDVVAAARVMYDIGNYYDFIARVGTFAELWVRYLLTVFYGFRLTDTEDTNVLKDRLEQRLEKIEGFTDFLKANGGDKMKPWKRNATHLNYCKIALSLISTEGPRESLLDALRQMRQLVQTRNECLHQFTGMSKDVLRKGLLQEPDIKKMKNLFSPPGQPDADIRDMKPFPDYYSSVDWKKPDDIVTGMRAIAARVGIRCPEPDVHKVLHGTLTRLLVG